MQKITYIYRPLLHTRELSSWAKQHKFIFLVPPSKLHVTIAFSRTPINMTQVDIAAYKLTVAGAPSTRSISLMGEQGSLALKFKSTVLGERFKALQAAGASWDYPEYIPHVTFAQINKDFDPDKVKPFTGNLVFGPEEVEELLVEGK